MTDTTVHEAEIIEAEQPTGLSLWFSDDAPDYEEEEFVFADPEDDPLAEIGGGIHRIKADGSDGLFMDDDREIGRVLEVIVLDNTVKKDLWVPKEGTNPTLEALLKGFPNDRPVCSNRDMFHEEARMNRDLDETQRHVLRSKKAGERCQDCELFKDCNYGRELLVSTPLFPEPVVIGFPATSAGVLREFFKKEFKLKGQSLAICTYPVRLTFEKVTEKDKNGSVQKFWKIKPVRGKKLPNEQIKTFLAMRDTYRISNRQKTQGALPAAAPPPEAGAAPPPAQQKAATPPAGDPDGLTQEEMF